MFKGFRCILPETETDCHDVTRPVPDYTTDAEWRRQTDTLRDALRGRFDHVTLLADSLEFPRTAASGFDGIGIYDNSSRPTDYAGYAAGASAAGLVFSFNVNPGFDAIEPRLLAARRRATRPRPSPRSLSGPRLVPRGGARARRAGSRRERIAASFGPRCACRPTPALANARRGFFLVYINSFNEWHEGHAFEPMKDAAELTAEERASGYHNPTHGRLPAGRRCGGLLSRC